ncbi:MAG: hypothetical protein QGG53_18735 [Planctomycetota bacterium]|nr:hypothetical protein [Planctomycetota bacterium]
MSTGHFVLWGKGAPLVMDHGNYVYHPWLHNRISVNHMWDDDLGEVPSFFAGAGASFVEGHSTISHLSLREHRLRAFEAGGARYAWAVNITELPEYRMLRRSKLGWPGEEKLTREEYLAYEKKMNFNAGIYRTKIAVGADDSVVYDVLTGQPVPVGKTENRRELPIVMPRLGGTLLMFLPRPIAQLELTAPKSVKTGGSAPVTIRLKDGAGELVPGVIPIELGIRGATGSQLRTEHVVVTNGEFNRELIVPVNETAKQWSITASTRFLKDGSQTVTVQIKGGREQ